jgi:hypothetical protein
MRWCHTAGHLEAPSHDLKGWRHDQQFHQAADLAAACEVSVARRRA